MYLTATLAFVFSFIYLNIPTYFFETHRPLEPKYAYYTFAVLIAPLLLLKFRKFVSYIVSPFSLWIFAEITVQSYDLLYADEDVAHLIMTRVQYLMVALVIGFAISIARAETFEGIFRILAITCPVLVIIDFISPGIFYPVGFPGSVPGRAAAVYVNPTMAGEAILITCLFAISTIRLQYRMPLILLAGAGIIMTFSRGSILVWMLFWLFLVITRKLPKYSFIFPIIALAVLPLLLSIFKSYLLGRQDIGGGINNILVRLDFFQTQSLNDNSAQERMAVLEAGWKVFLENPVFGGGSGITNFQTNIWPYAVNTHNQTVMIAAEHGILGIVLWVWLLVILWRGSYFQDTRFQMAATVGIILMSFFTHNMFDFLYWLVGFALISRRQQA